jgi:hypothetical protein
MSGVTDNCGMGGVNGGVVSLAAADAFKAAILALKHAARSSRLFVA